MPSERVSERAFLAVSVLLFAANAAETIIIWSASMSAMSGMPMPGGWTMSMAWMRMAGQTWSAAAASFLGMWVVRMVSMMLPPVVPMLRRYRQSVDGRGEMRLGRLTAFVGVGYCVEGTTLSALTLSAPGLGHPLPAHAGTGEDLHGGIVDAIDERAASAGRRQLGRRCGR